MSNVYQGSATTVISTKKEMKEATRNASKMLFIAGGVFVMMLTFICVSAFFKTPVYGATFEDESIADHLADPYSADSDFEFSENQDFCDSVKILSASAVKNVSGLFSAAIKQYGLFTCSVIYIAGGIMAAIFVILFKRSVILISRLLLRYSSMKDNRMMSAFSWSFIHK